MVLSVFREEEYVVQVLDCQLPFQGRYYTDDGSLKDSGVTAKLDWLFCDLEEAIMARAHDLVTVALVNSNFLIG